MTAVRSIFWKAARRAPTSQDAHADAGHADPLAAAEHDEAPAHATPQATRLPPPSQIADRLMIHLDALREIDPPETNARLIADFLTIPQDRAMEIAKTDYLFAD